MSFPTLTTFVAAVRVQGFEHYGNVFNQHSLKATFTRKTLSVASVAELYDQLDENDDTTQAFKLRSSENDPNQAANTIFGFTLKELFYGVCVVGLIAFVYKKLGSSEKIKQT